MKTTKPATFRYGIGAIGFVLTLLVASILSHFSINVDLSLLVIAAIICSAWYGGVGPGVMVAILFELAYMLLSTQRPASWLAIVVVEFNRTVLLLILALLVSYQKKVMTRLKEQGEWLRVTLFSIADGVITTEHNGRVNFMNPTAEAMTGYTSSQAAGRPVDEIFQIIDGQIEEILENPILKIVRCRAIGIATGKCSLRTIAISS